MSPIRITESTEVSIPSGTNCPVAKLLAVTLMQDALGRTEQFQPAPELKSLQQPDSSVSRAQFVSELGELQVEVSIDRQGQFCLALRWPLAVEEGNQARRKDCLVLLEGTNKTDCPFIIEIARKLPIDFQNNLLQKIAHKLINSLLNAPQDWAKTNWSVINYDQLVAVSNIRDTDDNPAVAILGVPVGVNPKGELLVHNNHQGRWALAFERHAGQSSSWYYISFICSETEEPGVLLSKCSMQECQVDDEGRDANLGGTLSSERSQLREQAYAQKFDIAFDTLRQIAQPLAMIG